MSSFESMSEDDKLLYAHALERKGRELVELLLRKRRVAQELGPLLPLAELEGVLAKIHTGIDGRILAVQAEAVATDARPIIDPDDAAPIAITS